MCQACRALVPASEKHCPMCGREAVPARTFLHASTGGHFISIIILTINIALFVLMALVEMRNGAGAEAFMQSASTSVLGGIGALYPGALANGEWWRLVTWNFLHIGLVHLLFNSIALYQVGPQVEEIFGSAKFIFIYLVTGVVAGLASMIISPSFTAGASGALFGLIGLMAAYGYRLGGVFGRALMKSMLIWAAFGFAIGMMPGINNIAHGGGFVAGVALAFVIPAESTMTVNSARLWNAVMIACMLIVAASFAMAGRNFNQAQERAAEEVQLRHVGQDVISLSRRIHSAEDLLSQSYDAPPPSRDAQQLADSLRAAGRDVMSVSHIDDRSDQIKQQYAELLNRRAEGLEMAAKDKKPLSPATPAEVATIKNMFKAYDEWEESVLSKYQLVRGRH